MCWDIVKNQSDIQSWLQPLPWQTYLSLCTGSVLTTSDTFKSPRHTNCQLKWTSQGILKKWSSSGRNEPRLFASLLGKYLSCHELKLFISCPSALSSARWIMNYELAHRPHLSRELQTTSEKWFLVPGHDRPGSCHVTHFYPSDSVSKSRMSQSSNRSTITITTDASGDCLVSLFFITNYIVYMRWSLAGQRPHQSSSLSDVLTCLLGQSEIEYIISISLFLNDPLNGITWNKYIMWPASSKDFQP